MREHLCRTRTEPDGSICHGSGRSRVVHQWSKKEAWGWIMCFGFVLLIFLSGCCSSTVARSADMLDWDLRIFVESSVPKPGVNLGEYGRAERALLRHAAELKELTRQ